MRPKTLTLAAYGFIALPLAAMMVPVFIFLPTHYAQTLGLGLAAVGLVRFIAGLWDVFTDPIVGWLSDRTRTKWGRRIPWLVAGTPLVMLSGWMLLSPPETMNIMHYLLWSMALFTGWTMIVLPVHALGAELSPDYHERSRITGWREGLAIGGTILCLIIIALTPAPDGDYSAALRNIALVTVILLPISALLLFRFVKEPPALVRGRNLGFKAGLNVLAQNKPFQRLILSYLLNGIANGLPATLMILFVDHVLDRPGGAGPFLFVYFLCGIFSVPLWLWLSKKHGKHRVWCWAMLWACAVFLLVPLIGSGETAFYMAICVLTGLAYGADMILPSAMQADVIDIDTAQTGQQRSGLYFAMWGMATKLALAIAAGAAFSLLDLMDHENGHNDMAIIALYALAPVAFKVAALALMWNHPLDEKAVQENARLISARWQ